MLTTHTHTHTHTFAFQWTTSGLPLVEWVRLNTERASPLPWEELLLSPLLVVSDLPWEFLLLTSALLLELLRLSLTSALPCELERLSLPSDFPRELFRLNLPSDFPLELFLLTLPSDLLLELLRLSLLSDFPLELFLLNLPSDLPLELFRLSLPPKDGVCESFDVTVFVVLEECECLLGLVAVVVLTWPMANWLPLNPNPIATITSESPSCLRVLLRSIQLREKNPLFSPNLRGIFVAAATVFAGCTPQLIKQRYDLQVINVFVTPTLDCLSNTVICSP